MEKFCQSCGMPLTTENVGTEADGTHSNQYCQLCYANGKFTDENMTFDEMLKIGLDGIDKSNNGTVKKWFIKKMYPSQLKHLKRWEAG